MSSDTSRYIAYYRVSTEGQGESGLGLDAQKRAVREFVSNGHETEIVAEFEEVASGAREDRPQLEEALRTARLHNATLVVSKLDRLARNAGFLHRLKHESVDIKFANMPDANGLTVDVLAAVAEHERRMISERTKDGLREAKRRGVQLGTPENLEDADPREGARASANVRTARADAHAADLAPVIEDLREAGASSLRKLAAGLEERGIPTTRGGYNYNWTATAVSRVLDRIERMQDEDAAA